MTYNPKPFDTTKIKLSSDIEELTEKLAKNVHENWVLERLSNGWTYGMSIDDENKIHPSLIEYEKLSNSEKQVDRVTAMETVKTIISLGYKIIKIP